MGKATLTAALILALATPALAGPMPELPELPPLPTDYVGAGGHEGAYAGVLGGATLDGDTTAALGVVAGSTMMAADLLLGVEALGLLSTDGDASLEFGLRGGFELDPSVAVFGHAGLGYASDTGSFVSFGSSIDFAVFDTVTLRTQYRYAHDLSGDDGRHAVLAGALFRF